MVHKTEGKMEKQKDGTVQVLICDDDPADRKLLRNVLSKIRDRKFKIDEAGSREEIERALKKEGIDLILLDLAMPEKSGKVWLSEIVEKEIAPVIIITGHGELEDSFEAMRFGAYAYISKNWLLDMGVAIPTIRRTVNYALDQWALENDLDEQMKRIRGITKVLICDDDPADRKLLKTYLGQLKGMQFEISEAGSEKEIGKALEKGDYKIIFMDHSMPGKSGMEWVEEIVAADIAPVVMVTSHGSEELAVEAMKKGAVDYISKDMLSAKSLFKSISEII